MHAYIILKMTPRFRDDSPFIVGYCSFEEFWWILFECVIKSLTILGQWPFSYKCPSDVQLLDRNIFLWNNKNCCVHPRFCNLSDRFSRSTNWFEETNLQYDVSGLISLKQIACSVICQWTIGDVVWSRHYFPQFERMMQH